MQHARRKGYRTKWARRWINFALTVRTALLVLGCLAATARGAAFRAVKQLFLGK